MDNHAALAAGLERAVANLIAAGKQVWLVGPVPVIGYNVPRTLYLESLGIPGRIDIRPTREEFNEREGFVLALFADIVKKYPVRVVWPHQSLCNAKFCRVEKDGRPLYIDFQHLTRSAAMLRPHVFDPIFSDALQQRRSAAEAP
jgi:SGNH domain (fused to AT3 domains)